MVKKVLRNIATGVVMASLLIMVSSVDTDAARLNLRTNSVINELDIKVVDAFTDSFDNFISDVYSTAEGETPDSSSISALNTNNDTLQNHSFKDLNDEYLAAANGIKDEAASITTLAEEVNTTAYDGTPTEDRLDEAMQDYNARLTAMTSAVALYEEQADDRREGGNQLMGYIGIGIGALVVLGIIILAVYTTKKSKARRLQLFANDPDAFAIDKQTQVILADVLNGLYQYEKDLKSGDANLMTNTRKYTYDLYQVQASDPSVGKYRSIILEYGALIAISAHDSTRAAQLLDEAEKAKGSRDFYTETARNFTAGS